MRSTLRVMVRSGHALRRRARCAPGVTLALGALLVVAASCGRSVRVIGGGAPATPSASGGAAGKGDTNGEGGNAGPGLGGAGGEAATAAEELDACLYFVRAVCNKVFFECNGAPNSADPCPPATDSSCPDRYFSYGSRTDVTALVHCASEWTSASCDDIRAGQRPDCLPRGLIDDRQPCVFGAQCASGYCAASTNPDGSPGCGACVPLAFAGDDCSGGNVHCFEGLACIDGTCAPGPSFGLPPGAPCDRLGACADGYYCLQLPGDDAPSCQVAPAAGEDCPLDTPFCQGNCNADRVCEAAPGRNDACALGANDAHVCELGLRCDLSAPDGPICAPPLALGAACTPLNADFSSGGCSEGSLCHCDDGACASGTCVKRRDEGDSCDGPHDVCLAGTRCENGVCTSSGSQELYVRFCARP
jgi:hypothetical protein